ncbi:Protein of unknown function [Gryllus bimaculatus]|nr:Protein of unknown function [Gryllus bimaculatus]
MTLGRRVREAEVYEAKVAKIAVAIRVWKWTDLPSKLRNKNSAGKCVVTSKAKSRHVAVRLTGAANTKG